MKKSTIGMWGYGVPETFFWRLLRVGNAFKNVKPFKTVRFKRFKYFKKTNK